MVSGVTTITTTVVTAIPMVLALLLLPSPNLAFTTTPTQSYLPITNNNKNNVASQNFALSAKDSIFSLNDDDDDDDEEIDAVDSNDIGEIVKDLLAEENGQSSHDAAADTTDSSDSKRIGDPLRDDNGVRPSIHPTAINAIAEALKARAAQSLQSQSIKADDDDDDDDDMMYFSVSDTVEPLMVMVTAGQFASDAIQKRQESSEEDGMLLNQGEEQTLAGRIMGVLMRLDDLEAELAERTADVDWVAQYDEWGSFGVLKDEHERETEINKSVDDETNNKRLEKVHAKIIEDPLFCMNRAECLLAIFLQEIEIPQLKKLEETVPDGSTIDFLDEDRRKVVLGNDD